MMQLNVTPLNAKAMLVKLTVRRANLTRRDTAAESYVQSQLDDTSLVVSSKLFRDKHNPVNQLVSKVGEVYTYHKNHTLAYVDKGPRLLPNVQYMDYSAGMRNLIASVDAIKVQLMPNYDKYVQLDIQHRSLSASSRAKLEDYPTADEFEASMGFELKFMPLPDAAHFLFDINEDDKAAFVDMMGQVEQGARNETIKMMLEPLGHLVDKLNKPIGTEGSIFRESAIDNIVENIDRARKLNVSDDPEVTQMIDTLSAAVNVYTGTNVLRESPIVREQAAKKLDYIAKQMGALYR
jgi:hypothetical protein